MTGEIHFDAGMTALFAQPGGAGKDIVYLGCHDVESIDEPLGDYTPRFCPDPSGTNRWLTVGEEHAPPEAVTFDITEDVTGALSILREQKCPIPIYINLACGTRRDVFVGAVKTFIADVRKITSRTINNLLMRESSERMEATYSLAAAPPLIEIRSLTAVTLEESETETLNDISFCSDQRCAGVCGDESELCEVGFVSASAGTAAAANILGTTNSGVDWASTATQPFAIVEDVVSSTCFDIDKDTSRWLVVRGTEVAPANPVEIAYSDDSGATWALVDVEAADTRFANDSGALWSLDSRHIWLVATEGYVFFSSDGGLTWAPQTEGDVTAEDMNAVHFINQNVGAIAADNGIVLVTDDGGTTWATTTTVVTGTPNVYCVKIFNENKIYVGTADGHVYVTFDGGVTWESQVQVLAGAVNDIDFSNEFVLWAVIDTAAPVGAVYRTKNGGTDWESITTPTNTGLNAIYACNSNTAYAVGSDAGGAFITKVYG